MDNLEFWLLFWGLVGSFFFFFFSYVLLLYTSGVLKSTLALFLLNFLLTYQKKKLWIT